MTDKRISNFEFGTLNYFITRAFLIGIIFNALVNAMKQDSWIIPILSVIPAFIFIFIINYIMNYEPNLDISQKIIKLFKNKIGIVILLILVLLFYSMCVLNYLNLNNFVKSQFLNKTPLLAISIMFAAASFYILSKGFNVLSRTSNILFYIGIILVAIGFVGLLSVISIDNLKPFLISNTSDYIKGFNSYYAFNIMPIFLLTIVPKNNIKNPKIKKTLILSYLLSAITIFLLIFQTIATLGYELTMLYEYPEFLVLKHVNLIGLSSRIESILIMKLLFDIFIFNCICIHFISCNIKTIFKINSINLIYFIVCFLIAIGTVYISKYNVYIDSLMENCIPIVLSIISIIIVLLICIKIKMSK